MHRGYVKLWRKAIESPVWADPDLWRTWCCCLMLANYKQVTVLLDKGGSSITLQPGQFVTGQLSFHRLMYPKKRSSNPSSRTVWRWLHALENLENVSIKSSNKLSIVTVCNWEVYQSDNFENVKQIVTIVSPSCHDRVNSKESKEGKEEDKESTIVDSSVPPLASAPTAAGFRFAVQHSDFWDLPQRKLDQYLATYADRLDVSAELRKAKQWLTDHRNRRKTKQGMPGFLTRWLNKAYDSATKTMDGSRAASTGYGKMVFNAESGELVKPYGTES